MPIVTTKEMFADAYKRGYAVGAFNVDNVDTMQGVLAAAVAERSPVIIAVTEKARAYMHPAYIRQAIKAAAEECDVPIALHLDHGKSFEICKACVDDGFTSVMIDASSLEFEQNIELTRKVVEYAHARGVVVESELGAIAGVEDDVCVDDKYGKFTHPDDVIEFVSKTDIDSLAIAIGTAHGAYKFKPGQKPQLRFDILEEIQQRLPMFPLVLHGASSVPKDRLDVFNQYGGNMPQAIGIPEEMLRKAASMAVCKINVGSDIRICYLGEFRRQLATKPSAFDSREFLIPSRQAVQDMVAHKMRNVLGSSNKA